MGAEIRCFFALWPDAELAQRLSALAEGAVGRRMREETLHLTLAFLGNVPDGKIADLCRVARQLSLPAEALEIDHLHYQADKKICWAGFTRLPQSFLGFVMALQADLRAAGFALEERDFVAHITLLRNVRHMAEAGVDSALPLVWLPARWALVASMPAGNGRRYETLAEWPARAGHSAEY